MGGYSLTGSAWPGLRVICYGKVGVTREAMERVLIRIEERGLDDGSLGGKAGTLCVGFAGLLG